VQGGIVDFPQILALVFIVRACHALRIIDKGRRMFSTFIDSRPVREWASVCGVSIFTVYGWKRNNAIPRRHWDAIIAKRWASYATLRDWDVAAKAEKLERAA
jgi:hypothetical protein